ncbi:hypothetical protein [Streptomyces sp. NPDC001948]
MHHHDPLALQMITRLVGGQPRGECQYALHLWMGRRSQSGSAAHGMADQDDGHGATGSPQLTERAQGILEGVTLIPATMPVSHLTQKNLVEGQARRGRSQNRAHTKRCQVPGPGRSVAVRSSPHEG